MSKHKILLYAPTSSQSGVTSVISNLFGGLDSNEFVFDIISFSSNEKLKGICQKFNGKFYALDIFYLKHPIVFKKKFKDIITGKRYEAVVFNISYLYIASLYFIAKSCGIPSVVFYSHSSRIEMNSFVKRIILEFIHKFNQIRLRRAKIIRVACSEKAGKWLYGNDVPFIVLKNGILTEKFAFNPNDRVEIRRKLGIDKCKVIGNVGRLAYSKNQLFLIKAFQIAHRLDKNTMLLIIGEGPDRTKLNNLIQELKMADCCRLLGNRQDIHKVYSALDLFVLPSIFEGAPVSAIEAQDNGLPCLLSETVSHDTKVNDNVKFVPINSVEIWGQEMVNSLNIARLRKAEINLMDNGWDTKSASQMLKSILLEK